MIVGGPSASLEPEAVRPHADILFTGEMEDIAATFFANLEAGTWKAHYDGGRADIGRSPVPRWALYPVHCAMVGALQTTRGCPFECEFYDVIQYQGRKQRQKTTGQVRAELDALYAAGFRETFLTDDDFTVHRQFARTVLAAMAGWNDEHRADPMRFTTQASIDIAREPDMLHRCVEAGLTKLFIGVETINLASLRETRKRQNLLMAIDEALRTIASWGSTTRVGLIIGFDHDGPDIFERSYAFLQNSPLPDVTLNVLNASKATPLYKRLETEGRLLDGRWDGANFSANFIPKLMSREDLNEGVRSLTGRLFQATAFERRVMNMIACFADTPAQDARRVPTRSERSKLMMTWLKRISARSPAEQRMVSSVLDAAAAKPSTLPAVLNALMRFERVNAVLERVDDGLLEATAAA